MGEDCVGAVRCCACGFVLIFICVYSVAHMYTPACKHARHVQTPTHHTYTHRTQQDDVVRETVAEYAANGIWQMEGSSSNPTLVYQRSDAVGSV